MVVFPSCFEWLFCCCLYFCRAALILVYVSSLQLPCSPICESFEPTKAPSTVAPTSIPTASIGSIQPTDCYDLHGVTEEDMIRQTGSDEPIPEDAIKIVNGEASNITIGKYLLTRNNGTVQQQSRSL